MHEERLFFDALHRFERKSEVALSIEYKQIHFILDFLFLKA